MCKEINYVAKETRINKYLATSNEDAKEKYYRFGLDKKDAGDTIKKLEFIPEYLDSDSKINDYKETSGSFIMNLYDNNVRLQAEVHELRKLINKITFQKESKKWNQESYNT